MHPWNWGMDRETPTDAQADAWFAACSRECTHLPVGWGPGDQLSDNSAHVQCQSAQKLCINRNDSVRKCTYVVQQQLIKDKPESCRLRMQCWSQHCCMILVLAIELRDR